MPTLSRKLLGYRWELDGKKTRLIDEGNNVSITLDKVRLMSFMKFAVNVLDKMRIEEVKQLKAKNKNKKLKIKLPDGKVSIGGSQPVLATDITMEVDHA